VAPAKGSGGFDADSAVEPLGEGIYGVGIVPEWSAPPGPNGGYIAALHLRAMRAEIGEPEKLPRSLTLHYLRPPSPGEATIEVVVERSGRTATTCTARMSQGGKLTTIAIGVLTTDYESAADWAPSMPEVDPPEAVEPLQFGADAGAPAIFKKLETRVLWGPLPFTNGDEAKTGGWLRAVGEDRLTPELLTLYTDAWWPPPFGVLDRVALAPTLELTIHFRSRLRDDEDSLVLARFDANASIDGLFDEQGEVWSRDGRLLAQSRQLALLRPWNPPG
jgi:acyl-CoA thioesterase